MYSSFFVRYEQQIAFGFVMLLSALRFLTMCDTVPKVNVIGRTLYKSLGALSRFSVVLFVIMSGFASMFHIAFCTTIKEFQSFGWSLFSLFRAMLGDLPLDQMVFHFPVLASVLFCFFVFLVVFIVFNLVIAIITDSYAAGGPDCLLFASYLPLICLCNEVVLILHHIWPHLTTFFPYCPHLLCANCYPCERTD